MTSFVSLLVGDGSVLVRCGELLMAKGHRINAVISTDLTVRAWAAKAGIPQYALDDAVKPESRLSADILFSIGNYSVIPDALLQRVGRMSINYHYGPLPEYSGLHVPAWAVYDRATDYAITWHRIGEIIDGGNLVRLAETEILAPLDAEAKQLVLDAAKRVSLVTAVSPRALVDVAYVVFEAGRLIRRLSELYGGRPGTLGFFRLTRSVLAHLAVTGSIAVGDSFVQQIVGHGLAARLSAKLGEGVVNGMMTARIGIAAMETVRPLPFTALRRPGMGDFLSALSKFTAGKAADKSPDGD